ncbi:MAG: 3-oxoacyl-ACP reductase FabG [Ignavibacteria bacterium]|nr:MAG: 3-oxoacyl-ACP reductase FabG [Ignavibacteria bacterium]
MKLNDYNAIITGGAKGIGEATVRKFVGEGSNVMIWDLDDERGERLAKELSVNVKCSFLKVDISNYEEVNVAFQQTLKEFNKIDVLVNNAGITMDSTLKKMTPEKWQKVIDVNLTGVFNCTQLISLHMLENGSGVILNAASVVALYGNFGQTNYVASKSGIIGMTKVWARELGPKGIRVNAVAPGFIKTEMVAAMPQNVLETMESKTPLRRLGRPEDIANAYAFLASEDASFVNGAVLSVDGGLVI